MVRGLDSKFCNYNRRKCLNFTTLYPDGRLAICDTFSIADFPLEIDPSRSFGENLHAAANSPVMQPLVAMLTDCERCAIVEQCNGGCLSQRFAFRQHAPELYEDYCQHRTELLRFIAELLETAPSPSHTHAPSS